MAAADLLVEALPPEAARRRALAAAAPALEAELVRRCRLVAAAAGYSTETDDFSGLPDHILQLLDARSQASQVRGRVHSRVLGGPRRHAAARRSSVSIQPAHLCPTPCHLDDARRRKRGARRQRRHSRPRRCWRRRASCWRA